MDDSNTMNFPTLIITDKISLMIEPCGVVFKKHCITKSGYQFHQKMPLSFTDFLKFSTHVREIKEWIQKAQNTIPSLESLESLNRPEMSPIKLSSESAIFLTFDEGKNQYIGRWFVNAFLAGWFQKRVDGDILPKKKLGISFNLSDLKVMTIRVWEICDILHQISVKHLHLSSEEELSCNLCYSTKKGPIHFFKITINMSNKVSSIGWTSVADQVQLLKDERMDERIPMKIASILKNFKDRHVLLCFSVKDVWSVLTDNIIDDVERRCERGERCEMYKG